MHLLYSRFFTKAMRDLGLIGESEPFTRLFNQGQILGADGERMSKSLGTGADPVALTNTFGADAVRFYLLDSFATGRDGEFTLEQFVEHVNTHLANKLGNLSSRTATLVGKNFDGKVPTTWNPDAITGDDARAGLEFAGEAVVHAFEMLLFRITEIQVGEKLPRFEREAADERLLDFAEAAHEPRDEQPGDAVGEQKVEFFLLQDTVPDLFGFGFYLHGGRRRAVVPGRWCVSRFILNEQ